MMASQKGVIVLGHPRSGTTLLRRLLSAHPQLAAPPETFLFDAAARFLHSDESAQGTDVGVLAGLNFIGFDDDETLSRLRNLCFGFLDEYAKREKKSTWVEKTAFSAFRIPEIVQLCQNDVRYIGIVRHPFDVALSTIEFCERMGAYPETLHRYIRQEKNFLKAFITSWRDVAQELMNLGREKPDDSIIIRYEDLIDETKGTISELLSFIGVDDNIDFLDHALEKQGTPGFSDHKAYRSKSINRSSAGRWRKVPKTQLGLLAPLVTEEMELLGYENINTNSDSKVDRTILRRAYLHGLEFSSKDQ